jgi:hypothetical protein
MYIYAVWLAYLVFGTLSWLKWWPGISAQSAFMNTVVGGLLLWILGSAFGYILGTREGEEHPDPLRIASATVGATLMLFAFAAMIAGQP